MHVRETAWWRFTVIQNSSSSPAEFSVHCWDLLVLQHCCTLPVAAGAVQHVSQKPGEVVTPFISWTKCNKGKQTRFPSLLTAGQSRNVSNYHPQSAIAELLGNVQWPAGILPSSPFISRYFQSQTLLLLAAVTWAEEPAVTVWSLDRDRAF